MELTIVDSSSVHQTLGKYVFSDGYTLLYAGDAHIHWLIDPRGRVSMVHERVVGMYIALIKAAASNGGYNTNV